MILAALLVSRGMRTRDGAAPNTTADSAAGQTGETVSLAIDYGPEGGRKDYAVPWREGMTVADALHAAGGTTGRLEVSHQGSGEATFLTEIGGVSNEGAGGRNWTYRVNGTLADRSFAVYPLRPGDQVLWTFAAGQ
jgi:hypothetical protein